MRNSQRKMRAYRRAGKMFGAAFNPSGLTCEQVDAKPPHHHPDDTFCERCGYSVEWWRDECPTCGPVQGAG